MPHGLNAVSRQRPQRPPPPFQRLGHLKAMAGTLAATGTLVPSAMMVGMVNRDAAGRMPAVWHRAVAHALGVRSRLSGEKASGGVLYVVNHLSWLDIPVLGGWLDGSFVAKSEVELMPFMGFLARFQNTIYVERERRAATSQQADTIRGRLRAGGNVILFPEGTSGAGVQVLPFKSSLFAVADGEDEVRIQPVSLAYTRINGTPMTRQRLADIAWTGDTAFGAHAIGCMRLGRIDAVIHCHPPVRRREFADRKELARHCQRVIADGYRRLLRA